MRAIVMVVFFGWLCASVALTPRVEVGLDQELSMPEDSYMLDYFSVSLHSITSIEMPKIKFNFDYVDSILPSICLSVLPFTSSSRKASSTTRISWRSKNCVVVVAATPTLSSLKSIWHPRTRVAHTSPLRPPLGSMTTLIGLESQSVAKLNLTNTENSNSVQPSNLVRLFYWQHFAFIF